MPPTKPLRSFTSYSPCPCWHCCPFPMPALGPWHPWFWALAPLVLGPGYAQGWVRLSLPPLCSSTLTAKNLLPVSNLSLHFRVEWEEERGRGGKREGDGKGGRKKRRKKWGGRKERGEEEMEENGEEDEGGGERKEDGMSVRRKEEDGEGRKRERREGSRRN